MKNREATTVSTRPARRDERGQVLIIVGLSMVIIVAMVGVVIDGGFAWGKQRDTQNAADAIAKAGAVKLTENLANKQPANTDADVLDAMQDTADANAVELPNAFYTDFDGNMLTAGGTTTTVEAAAVEVGNAPGGAFPPGTAGVRAVGQQTFDTFLARVIGFDQFTSRADATARSGWLTGTCEAGAGCSVLPVTIPVTQLGCDGTGKPAPVVDVDGDKILWTAPSAGPVVLPLCSAGPGNVGWLDWTPSGSSPNCPGTGKAELACIIADPSNPGLRWPGWYYVPETGNPNSGPIQTALDDFDDVTALIPQFDLTCNTTPSGPGVTDCPLANVGGNGTNQWYHLAGMSSFHLCTDSGADAAFNARCVAAGFDHGAYVQGNHASPCDTGNGSTSCFAGEFVVISYEGEVAQQPGVNSASSVPGIQLIR
jgi:Flp pilus assembly protein TadG